MSRSLRKIVVLAEVADEDYEVFCGMLEAVIQTNSSGTYAIVRGQASATIGSVCSTAIEVERRLCADE